MSMDIGFRIRRLREGCRKTQEQLARDSGLSRDAIASLEQGRQKNPTLSTLIQISKACGGYIGDLFPQQSEKSILVSEAEDISSGEHPELRRKIQYVLSNSRRKESALIAVVEALYREVKSKERNKGQS